MEQVTDPEKKIIKISYKELYIKEKEKRKNSETNYNIEIEKLKLLLKSKETELEDATNKIVKHINSQTAKNGYKEEKKVCDDLLITELRNTFSPILGNDYDECSRICGNHKCDIRSNNKKITGQVKRYTNGRFQQLDRHWVDDFIESIPQLIEASQILKDLFEYPLLPNGTHIDKSIPIKKLCTTNYSTEELTNLLILLNEHKRLILNYAFLGTNLEIQPEYLFGVEYINNKRDNIVLFKIKQMIDYAEKLDFKISPRKTVIILGDGIISLQRKGGDGEKKYSNQLQIKLIVSKFVDKVENLKYKL